MFGLFTRKSRGKDFAPVELSLINTESLKAELAPFVEDSGVPPSPLTGEERDKELGKIIKAHFPEDTLDRLKQVAIGKIREPVIIHNLPTEQETINRLAHKGRGEASKLYCTAIARGVYAALDLKPIRNSVLRRRHDGDHDIPGDDMHKDETQFSILACALNTNRAATRFFDLQSAAASLTRRERESIMVEEYINCRLLVPLEEFCTMNKNVDATTTMKIADSQCKDKRALLKFKHALEEKSFDITFKPGTMALFNNREVYHQASPEIQRVGLDIPEDEPKHSVLSRVMVFTPGEGISR